MLTIVEWSGICGGRWGVLIIAKQNEPLGWRKCGNDCCIICWCAATPFLFTPLCSVALKLCTVIDGTEVLYLRPQLYWYIKTGCIWSDHNGGWGGFKLQMQPQISMCSEQKPVQLPISPAEDATRPFCKKPARANADATTYSHPFQYKCSFHSISTQQAPSPIGKCSL